jgi:phage baseplate assembly protein W
MTDRLSWPIRLNPAGSGFVTVEQETSKEVLDSAENVLRTVQGERPGNPDYGVPETLFELGGPDTQPFIDAIERWEPRALLVVDVSEVEGMISRVRTEISA